MSFESNNHPQQSYWKNLTAPPPLPSKGSGQIDGLDDVQRNFGDPEEALRIDKSDPQNVYLGFLEPKWNTTRTRVFFEASESDFVWMIVKIEDDGLGLIKRLYPEGSRDYSFSWTDRTTYSYS